MHLAFVFQGVVHIHCSDREGAKVLDLNIVKGLTVKPDASWSTERAHVALTVKAPASGIDIDEPRVKEIEKL